MKLIRMECPYCGADLEAEEGKKTLTCPYCGKTVKVQEDVKQISFRDEAKLREAELKEKEYEDRKAEKQKAETEQKVHAYKKSIWGKLDIILIICGVIGVIAHKGFLSVLIALIQIILAVLARRIATDKMQDIHGVKVPHKVLTVIAAVLIIPYSTCAGSAMDREKTGVRYTWPSTEIAERLPKPKSKYGEILNSDEEMLEMEIYRMEDDDFNAYLDAVKKKGFTQDASSSGNSYEALDQDGYDVSLHYDDDEEEMQITATAPEEYGTISWPLNSPLAKLLPEPPVLDGNIINDSSSSFSMELKGVDEDAFSKYADAVRDAGFTNDYSRYDTGFQGTDGNGNTVWLTLEKGGIMDVSVDAPSVANSTPKPSTTPDPTPVPAETEAPAAASGIRPEFQASMDSYKAFFDQYCDFMRSADQSSPTYLAEYADMMAKYEDCMQKMDAVDESQLSPEEDALYVQTQLDINAELAQLEAEL